jgi:hypothetical protein
MIWSENRYPLFRIMRLSTKALAGLGRSNPDRLYRRWGIPPRPENTSRPAGRPGLTMPVGDGGHKRPDRSGPGNGHAMRTGPLRLPGRESKVNAPRLCRIPIPFCSRLEDSGD